MFYSAEEQSDSFHDDRAVVAMDTTSIEEQSRAAEQTQRLVGVLRQNTRKFQLACKQVLLLNNQIQALEGRYSQARADGLKALCYSLKLRISSLEGVRNMFYTYTMIRAEELDDLHQHLVARGVINSMEPEDLH